MKDIHRIGRTARAGNEGRGVLILTKNESFFMRKRQIAALPIIPCDIPQAITGSTLAHWNDLVREALLGMDDATKAQTYQVCLTAVPSQFATFC